MPSPKPVPAALKLLRGTSPGRDSGGRLVKPPPPLRRIPPNPPTTLPREAKAEWRRIVAELGRLEILSPSQRGCLAAYCLAWDRLMAAQKTIDREGMFQTDGNGKVSKHPAVLVVEAASKELRAMGSEFGLTPSSESRIDTGVPDNDDENPFA